MTDESDRPARGDRRRRGTRGATAAVGSTQPAELFSTRRLVSVALMTVLGLAVFVFALVSTEPNWVLWIFGGLMVFSALTFWSLYALHHLRSRRRG